MRVYFIYITVGTRIKLETNSGGGSIFHVIEIAEKLRRDDTNFLFLSDCKSILVALLSYVNAVSWWCLIVLFGGKVTGNSRCIVI